MPLLLFSQLCGQFLTVVRLLIQIIIDLDLILDVELLRHRRLCKDLRRRADEHQAEINA